MAGQFADALLQGFNTGLGIRRNLEETAQLVHAREQQAQAEELFKQDSLAAKAAEAEVTTLKAKQEAMLHDQGMGLGVDEEGLKRQNSELVLKQFKLAQFYFDLAEKGRTSGNPVYANMTLGFLKNSMEVGSQLENILASQENAKTQRENVAGEAEYRKGMLGLQEKRDTREAHIAELQEKRLREGSFADRMQADAASFDARAKGVPLDEINQVRASMGLKPITEKDEPADVFGTEEKRAEYEHVMKMAEKEKDPKRKKAFLEEGAALLQEANDAWDTELASRKEKRLNPHWYSKWFGNSNRPAQDSAIFDIPPAPGTPKASGRNRLAGTSTEEAFNELGIPTRPQGGTDARGRPKAPAAEPSSSAIFDIPPARTSTRQMSNQNEEPQAAAHWLVRNETPRLRESKTKRAERIRKEMGAMAMDELQNLAEELRQRPVDDPSILEALQAEMAKRTQASNKTKLKNSTLKG